MIYMSNYMVREMNEEKSSKRKERKETKKETDIWEGKANWSMDLDPTWISVRFRFKSNLLIKLAGCLLKKNWDYAVYWPTCVKRFI